MKLKGSTLPSKILLRGNMSYLQQKIILIEKKKQRNKSEESLKMKINEEKTKYKNFSLKTYNTCQTH